MKLVQSSRVDQKVLIFAICNFFQIRTSTLHRETVSSTLCSFFSFRLIFSYTFSVFLFFFLFHSLISFFLLFTYYLNTSWKLNLQNWNDTDPDNLSMCSFRLWLLKLVISTRSIRLHGKLTQISPNWAVVVSQGPMVVAVPSDSRDLQFESCHQQFVFIVDCIKDEKKGWDGCN